MRLLVLSRMNQKCQRLRKRVMSMMVNLKRLAYTRKKQHLKCRRQTIISDIRNDYNINKDARFLDAIKTAFDEYEMSTVFKPHTTKMKLA